MINHKLLHDPYETVVDVRQLYERARATTYAVLIVPTPTGRRDAIARDVLRGLGKHLDLRHAPRTSAGLNDAARVWLEAHEITTLIIRNADRLDPSAWQELCAMTPRSCRAWLWVNPGQLTQAQAITGKRLGLENVTINDLNESLRWPRRPRDPVLALADDTPCPTVTAADFPVFAMACQQPGNDVSWANFVVGRAHVRWYTDRIARRPAVKAINTMLQAVAHAAPGTGAAIARVCGAQTQLLLAGIATTIDPRELRGVIAEHRLTPPDQRAARLLARYAQPSIAGPAAACLASGRGPGWLLHLVDHDIHTDRLGEYRIPATLQHLTRALVDPVVRGLWGEEPISLLHTLDAVTAQTGIRFNRDLKPLDTSPAWTSVSYLA